MNSPTNISAQVVVGCLMVAAGGCAGSSQTVRYGQLLGQAQSSIQQAKGADAYKGAGEQLTKATNKLDDAQKLEATGEEERATQLLEEAQVDANLATATARNQDMQEALTELQASIQDLREEINRHE